MCQDHLDHSKSDMFPLTYRPLGKQWFPGPRRPVSFLRSYYGTREQVCKSHIWSHARERSTKSVVEDCRKLMDKHPFVHRCPAPKNEFNGRKIGLCDEYLLNGSGQVIHKIRLPLDVSVIPRYLQ
nr:lipopolysaccharide choline [Hymenolepis microstoma]